MGLCEANLIRLLKYFKENGGMRDKSFCMLGRQEISETAERFQRISASFGFQYDEKIQNTVFDKRVDTYQFFYMMGFREVDAIDISEYDNPTIVFDLGSEKLPEELKCRFDYILDGGTSEHVFNAPQLMRNISEMLKPDGQIIHMVPCAGYVNHGFYSFSPDFFIDFYKKNGFDVKDVYITWFLENAEQKEEDRRYYASMDCRMFQDSRELNRYMSLLNKMNGMGRTTLWVSAQKKQNRELQYPIQQVYLEFHKKYEENRVDMDEQIDRAVDVIDHTEKNKITLFCAGTICARLLHKLYERSLESHIDCVLDFNLDKCNSRYYGIPVKYPNRQNILNKDIVICSDIYADEIFSQLNHSYSGIFQRIRKITEMR